MASGKCSLLSHAKHHTLDTAAAANTLQSTRLESEPEFVISLCEHSYAFHASGGCLPCIGRGCLPCIAMHRERLPSSNSVCLDHGMRAKCALVLQEQGNSLVTDQTMLQMILIGEGCSLAELGIAQAAGQPGAEERSNSRAACPCLGSQPRL